MLKYAGLMMRRVDPIGRRGELPEKQVRESAPCPVFNIIESEARIKKNSTLLGVMPLDGITGGAPETMIGGRRS